MGFQVVIQQMRSSEDIKEAVKKIIQIGQEPLEDNPLPSSSVKMPELALVMANYFNSISKYCFSIYRGYANNDDEVQKRKKEIRNQKNMKPPKKPLTAYLLFYSDRLCEVQKQNPSDSVATLCKAVSKHWGNLPPEEKRPYLQEAERQKQRYEENLQRYKEIHPEYDDNLESKRKAKCKQEVAEKIEPKREEKIKARRKTYRKQKIEEISPSSEPASQIQIKSERPQSSLKNSQSEEQKSEIEEISSEQIVEDSEEEA